MKKILWFSNCAFSNDKINTTGTWLLAMGEALMLTGKVQIYNITTGNVDSITRRDGNGIFQWIIPLKNINNNSLPSKKITQFIKKIETEINPDLIHIWGTENFAGILAEKGIFKETVLLEMQGVLNACSRVFYGGLTTRELFHCIGLKELLLPNRHLFFSKKTFQKKGIIESRIIKNFSIISTQSEWVRAHIISENSSCKMLSSKMMLRKEFYEANPWSIEKTPNPLIFTSSSGSIPYKGLHVLFRALAILKQKFPTVQLHIAGNIIGNGFIQDGYSKWLLKEAKKLNIQDSILWLGALNAEEIIDQFHKASVVVVPSFVESYCLALAESMLVGVPTVVSFAGAMPELAENQKSALFFPPGDYISCAWQIDKLLTNDSLAENISLQSRLLGLSRNNPEIVVQQQLDIYDQLIESK